MLNGLYDSLGELWLFWSYEPVYLFDLGLLLYYLLTVHLSMLPRTAATEASSSLPWGLSLSMLSRLINEHKLNKSFVASIVDLSVQGYIDLKERKGFFGSVFIVTDKRKEPQHLLSLSKQAIMRNLFVNGDSVLLSYENNKIIRKTIYDFTVSAERESKLLCFVGNCKYFIFGFLISLLFPVSILLKGAVIPLIPGCLLLAINVLAFMAFSRLIEKNTDLLYKVDCFGNFVRSAEGKKISKQVYTDKLAYVIVMGLEYDWTLAYLADKDTEDASLKPSWFVAEKFNASEVQKFVQTLTSNLHKAVASTFKSSSLGGYGGINK